MIHIRPATVDDIGEIMRCYEAAKRFMRLNGNHSQWVNGYPARSHVVRDIETGSSHVGLDDQGRIVMAFAFIVGNDPTYAVIENGEWLDDRPYAAIHRLGSDGSCHGVFRACVEFCAERIDNLRLDTHADNTVMQRAAEALGFVRCGIIYCDDGSPRIAYQRRQSQN